MSDSVRLQSEQFDRAASNLSQSMDKLDFSAFEAAAQLYAQTVDKFIIVAGMQAENESRKQAGLALAYSEEDFLRYI